MKALKPTRLDRKEIWVVEQLNILFGFGIDLSISKSLIVYSQSMLNLNNRVGFLWFYNVSNFFPYSLSGESRRLDTVNVY